MAEDSRFVKHSKADESSKCQKCPLLEMDDEMFAAAIGDNDAYHDDVVSISKFGD